MLKEIKQNKNFNFIFFLLIALCVSFIKPIDNDAYFLISLGRSIISNGIPYIDTLTMHENLNIVSQQWLSSVIFSGIDSLFGKIGFSIFLLIICSVIVFLSYKVYMLISKNNSVFSFYLSVFSFGLLGAFFICVRPQVFTFIMLYIEIYLLEMYSLKKYYKYLLPLPFLSVLLVNLHASMWPMLIVFMLPYMFEIFLDDVIVFIKNKEFGFKKFITKLIYNMLPFILGIIGIILAGFINPYGYKSMVYLFNSTGNELINQTVYEMSKPTISGALGCTIIVSIILFTAIICLNKNNKIPVRYLCFFLGTSLLSLMHIKGFSYFVVGSSLILAYLYKDKSSIFKPIKSGTTEKVILFFFIGFIALNLIAYPNSLKESCHLYEPVNQISLSIEQNKLDKDDVTVYANYNDGGYLEYCGLKPYIDARAELFLKSHNKQSDIFKEHIYMRRGMFFCDDFIKKYNFDYLLVTADDPLYHYLSDENKNKELEDDGYSYEMIYEGEDHQVWAKESLCQ